MEWSFQPFLVGIRLDQDQPRPVSNTFSSGKQRATQNRISMLSKSMHYLNIHAFELNHGYTSVGSKKCSHTFFLGKRPPLSATLCLRSVAGHVNFYFLVKGLIPRIDWVRFPRLKSVREYKKVLWAYPRWIACSYQTSVAPRSSRRPPLFQYYNYLVGLNLYYSRINSRFPFL